MKFLDFTAKNLMIIELNAQKSFQIERSNTEKLIHMSDPNKSL